MGNNAINVSNASNRNRTKTSLKDFNVLRNVVNILANESPELAERVILKATSEVETTEKRSELWGLMLIQLAKVDVNCENNINPCNCPVLETKCRECLDR